MYLVLVLHVRYFVLTARICEDNRVATPCPLMKSYETCVTYEKPAKGLMKNSSCERSFVLKVVPKAKESDIISELPKAIPWNMLKNKKFIYVCVRTLEGNVIYHCPGSHLDHRVLFDSNLFLCMCRDVHSKPSARGLH